MHGRLNEPQLENNVYVCVHEGSRKLGEAISSTYRNITQNNFMCEFQSSSPEHQCWWYFLHIGMRVFMCIWAYTIISYLLMLENARLCGLVCMSV